MKIFYLSGPMSGYDKFNYPEFFRVTGILRRNPEYIIINPAEYTMPGSEWTGCLTLDGHIIRHVPHLTGMIALPRWRASTGARIESYMTGIERLLPIFEIHFKDGEDYDLVQTKPYFEDDDLKIIENLTKTKLTKDIPIGITGELHAGKDTLADYIMEQSGKDYYKYSFAKPMKQIAKDIFGFTDAQLYDPIVKEQIDEFWEITPRRFLQLLGTDMFRDTFRDDVWIKLAEKCINEQGKCMMIPDVRFDNEAAFIKDQGGIVIHIKRDMDDAEESRKHVSEKGINKKYIDIVVNNNQTLHHVETHAAILTSMIDLAQVTSPLALGE